MEISREDFIAIIRYALYGYLRDEKVYSPSIREFMINLSDRVEFDKDKIIIIGIKD